LPDIADKRSCNFRSPLPPRSKSRGNRYPSARRGRYDVSPLRKVHQATIDEFNDQRYTSLLQPRSRSVMRYCDHSPNNSYNTTPRKEGSSTSSSRRSSREQNVSDFDRRSTSAKRVQRPGKTTSGTEPVPKVEKFGSRSKTFEMVSTVDLSDSPIQFSGSHISKNIREAFKDILPKVTNRKELKKYNRPERLEVSVEPLVTTFNTKVGPSLLPFHGMVKTIGSSLVSDSDRKPVHVYCLVDSSAAMAGTRIMNTRKIIKWMARSLSSECQMQVIALGDKTKRLCSLLSLNEFQKAEIGRGLDSIRCSGELSSSEAIVECLVNARSLSNQTEKRVFLFTTAQDPKTGTATEPTFINQKVYENFKHLTVFNMRPLSESHEQEQSLTACGDINSRSREISGYEHGQFVISQILPKQFPVLARDVEVNIKANSICPNGEFDLIQMVSFFNTTCSKCSTGLSYSFNFEYLAYGMEMEFVAILKQRRRAKASEAKIILPVISEEGAEGDSASTSSSTISGKKGSARGARCSVLKSALTFARAEAPTSRQSYKQDFCIPITTTEVGEPRLDNPTILHDYYCVKVLEVLRLAEISHVYPHGNTQLSPETAIYTREEFQSPELRDRPQLQALIADLEQGLRMFGF